ncbi:MAG: sigma-54-dependent Fis family transcriptional regulator [Nitrospinae bacterium]|nr:sigma-54-dependent Fis family transcriptional regulator [Nitrospinota bacterium]
MKDKKTVLIVEDEASLRLVLGKTVQRKGYAAEYAATVREAEALLLEGNYFAGFLDIRLPDGGGLELLSRIKNSPRQFPCVVMTADATMDNAIKAVKRGAFEYLVKPLDLNEIEQILDRLERRHELASSAAEEQPALVETGKYEIIGRSPAMQKLFKKIGRAAASHFTVLITGESGSGKELVARNLHEFSDRASKAFVPVNCSAIPKDLMESELFGHVKGAFTGADRDQKGMMEEADGGTLFMDEIGELSLKMQAKLLRMLEEGRITPVGSRKAVPVDVRFVAAPNRELEDMVKEGQFREDLFHRLNVIPIHVPPLRNRAGDVELLAKYFVKRHGAGKRISEDACGELEKRPWPGNVRQLQNAIKRALVMSSEDTLLPGHFSKAEEETPEELEEWIARMMRREGDGLYDRVIGQIESELIRQALEKCGGNKIQAAKLLGINRNTLTKKVKDYALE